jgi:hypothetical protein
MFRYLRMTNRNYTHEGIESRSYSGWSRDSAVSIATGYGLDDLRGQSSSPGGARIFSPSKSSRLALGSSQPPIQSVPGTLSQGVKRQGHETDHSPPTTAEVKKMWIYTSTPPYAFMA